jgi:acyl carrier protein
MAKAKMARDIKNTVRQYLDQNFLAAGDLKLADSDSLLQLQVVDSTGFLELVSFLEAEFKLKVADDEMVPENLESLDNIEQFVRRKSAA